MSISDDDLLPHEPVEARCDEDYLHVRLHDGRRISVPLWWYPRLLKATPKQRSDVRFSEIGLHWEEIDEDLSVEGLLRGLKARDAVEPKNEAA